MLRLVAVLASAREKPIVRIGDSGDVR